MPAMIAELENQIHLATEEIKELLSGNS